MDDAAANTESFEASPLPPRPTAITAYRHRLPTRLWHWVNALTVFIMLMSGLMIFNAHPHLYWGKFGANFDHSWLSFRGRPIPGWATIPSTYNLAAARRWHLAFAWLLSIGLILFIVLSLLNRHAQRDLRPTAEELRPRHIWEDIRQHARLRFPTGEAALRYNILQKLSYVSVIFLFLPLMLLTGLTMSPAMDAAWPWLLEMFAGRQSARSIHFICAMALLAFIIVHLVMVLLAGPLNEIRSMVTGRFRVPPETAGR
ncbi:MAG TPA: cytochrome b/b6 domain-containing protein [Sphingomicrobium sp.]|nr:cytochrome b/b6 domain-containing protein [Sphingomicrobium sp.]